MSALDETPHDGHLKADSTLDARAANRPRPRNDSADRHYLLVFEGDSSRMVALPQSGEVVIGRGDEADLKLTDTSVSRAHVKVSVSRGQVRIADLGSQNGTTVNDERITGSRALASGDVVGIASASLVLHLGSQSGRTALFVDPGALRQRIESELERALGYDRPLSVLHVWLEVDRADRPRVELALSEVCRRLDTCSWSGGDAFAVALPELDEASATEQAHRLLEALSPHAPRARAGLASCPADGCDVDTLLSSAREAGRSAAPSEVRLGRENYRTLELSGRTVVVADPVMVRLYDLIGRLARSDLPVLVCGETGAGKELAASALHHQSKRRERPLVAVNCAALQEGLLESELFGHERGAFTGAVGQKLGLLEAASGGTVFFDEVGELSLAIQAKLLRALDARRITRLGDVREREIDVRVVAATNRNLEVEVREGRFRQDLFFRLSGSILWMPPLRERKRELPILARALLAEACRKNGRPVMELSDAAMRRLLAHPWPGNVRELRNVMEFGAATVTEQVFEPWHLNERLGNSGFPAPAPASPEPSPASAPGSASLPNLLDEIRELERMRMAQALQQAHGNQTRAAQAIGMPLRTFVTKVKQYGMRSR